MTGEKKRVMLKDDGREEKGNARMADENMKG
jgi:hypothetical protein